MYPKEVIPTTAYASLIWWQNDKNNVVQNRLAYLDRTEALVTEPATAVERCC